MSKGVKTSRDTIIALTLAASKAKKSLDGKNIHQIEKELRKAIGPKHSFSPAALKAVLKDCGVKVKQKTRVDIGGNRGQNGVRFRVLTRIVKLLMDDLDNRLRDLNGGPGIDPIGSLNGARDALAMLNVGKGVDEITELLNQQSNPLTWESPTEREERLRDDPNADDRWTDEDEDANRNMDDDEPIQLTEDSGSSLRPIPVSRLRAKPEDESAVNREGGGRFA